MRLRLPLHLCDSETFWSESDEQARFKKIRSQLAYPPEDTGNTNMTQLDQLTKLIPKKLQKRTWTGRRGLRATTSEEEERDLHHQGMYMNGGRNHHFGPPPTQEG